MTSIYQITNQTNGHFYIGSSVDAQRRFMIHRYHLRNGSHHCQPLQRAWTKYGDQAFSFEIIEAVDDRDKLADAEGRWLAEHHGKPYCYNVSRDTKALWRGLRHTPESRAKMSEANKGNKARLGHKNSPEHREKISAAMKGKRKSPEHAEKIRKRMIGTSYAKGRVVTDEERAKRGRAVIELTTGKEFISVAHAAACFGLQRANVVRALRGDRPLMRGPHAGLHFRYLAPPLPQ